MEYPPAAPWEGFVGDRVLPGGLLLYDLCPCGKPATVDAGPCAYKVGSCGDPACHGTVRRLYTPARCAAIRELRRLGWPRPGPYHAAVWAAQSVHPRLGTEIPLTSDLDVALVHASLWGYGAGLCGMLLDAARQTLRLLGACHTLQRRPAFAAGMGDGLFATKATAAGGLLLQEDGLAHGSQSAAASVLAFLATVPDLAERARLFAAHPPPPAEEASKCSVGVLPPTFMPKEEFAAAKRAANATHFARRGAWATSDRNDCIAAHFATGRLLNHACGVHANASWGWDWTRPSPERVAAALRRLAAPWCPGDTDTPAPVSLCLLLNDNGGGWPVGTLRVVAKRPIVPGEEILIDYFGQNDRPTVAGNFPFDCACPGCI